MKIMVNKRKICSWTFRKPSKQLWRVCRWWSPDHQRSVLKIIFLFFFIAFITTAHSQQKNLDYFINAALQNSPLLKDYNNQVLINLIDSARIRAGYKPQINGKSTNLYAPVVSGRGYDEAITNIGNFSELITVDKQIINKKVLQNEINILHLQNNSLHVAGKISEQDLKKLITAQYIAAYGSWQQYLFNKQVYDLLAKEDTILKKLTQAAVYRQTDYLTFLVTLQQQQLTITQTKIQFQNDYATLNYLSGFFDTSFTPLTQPALELNYTPEIENTVYYQKFSVDSLILKATDAQIDLNYKPKISLYADAGYISSLQYLPYKNFGTSFGINLSVPIYDGRQRKMQHNKIVRIADYVIAINNYLNAKNIITQNTVARLQLINQINYWNRK